MKIPQGSIRSRMTCRIGWTVWSSLEQVEIVEWNTCQEACFCQSKPCSLQKERGTVRAQGGKSGKEEGKEDTTGMEEIGIGDGTHSNPSQGQRGTNSQAAAQ